MLQEPCKRCLSILIWQKGEQICLGCKTSTEDNIDKTMLPDIQNLLGKYVWNTPLSTHVLYTAFAKVHVKLNSPDQKTLFTGC